MIIAEFEEPMRIHTCMHSSRMIDACMLVVDCFFYQNHLKDIIEQRFCKVDRWFSRRKSNQQCVDSGWSTWIARDLESVDLLTSGLLSWGLFLTPKHPQTLNQLLKIDFDVFWCILMYFDVFWCILMYFDVWELISIEDILVVVNGDFWLISLVWLSLVLSRHSMQHKGFLTDTFWEKSIEW